MIARLRHGDISQLTEYITRLAVSNPTQLRELDPSIGLIQFELLRIGVAELGEVATTFELRKRSSLLEEVDVGAVEVFKRLLQRTDGGAFEPRRLGGVAPDSHYFAELGEAETLLALRRDPFVFGAKSDGRSLFDRRRSDSRLPARVLPVVERFFAARAERAVAVDALITGSAVARDRCRGSFVFSAKSDGRKRSTGVGVVDLVFDSLRLPVHYFAATRLGANRCIPTV